jgi:hypothetical protein
MSTTPELIFVDLTKNTSEDDKDSIKLWCEICDFLVEASNDIQTVKKFGCCEECWLSFGQMRKQDWQNGWRPSLKKLQRYKEKRRILNINVKKILGDKNES